MFVADGSASIQLLYGASLKKRVISKEPLVLESLAYLKRAAGQYNFSSFWRHIICMLAGDAILPYYLEILSMIRRTSSHKFMCRRTLGKWDIKLRRSNWTDWKGRQKLQTMRPVTTVASKTLLFISAPDCKQFWWLLHSTFPVVMIVVVTRSLSWLNWSLTLARIKILFEKPPNFLFLPSSHERKLRWNIKNKDRKANILQVVWNRREKFILHKEMENCDTSVYIFYFIFPLFISNSVPSFPFRCYKSILKKKYTEKKKICTKNCKLFFLLFPSLRSEKIKALIESLMWSRLSFRSFFNIKWEWHLNWCRFKIRVKDDHELSSYLMDCSCYLKRGLYQRQALNTTWFMTSKYAG